MLTYNTYYELGKHVRLVNSSVVLVSKAKRKSKAIPVTGCEGL
jgi:hypothetical protein